jgi:hypothetical protein
MTKNIAFIETTCGKIAINLLNLVEIVKSEYGNYTLIRMINGSQHEVEREIDDFLHELNRLLEENNE